MYNTLQDVKIVAKFGNDIKDAIDKQRQTSLSQNTEKMLFQQQEVPLKDNELGCPYCNFITPNKEMLTIHIDKTHNRPRVMGHSSTTFPQQPPRDHFNGNYRDPPNMNYRGQQPPPVFGSKGFEPSRKNIVINPLPPINVNAKLNELMNDNGITISKGTNPNNSNPSFQYPPRTNPQNSISRLQRQFGNFNSNSDGIKSEFRGKPCSMCAMEFEGTMNPSSARQQHMISHFKDKLGAAMIDQEPPFRCPFNGCSYLAKSKQEWCDHYGNSHGMLAMYERQFLHQNGIDSNIGFKKHTNNNLNLRQRQPNAPSFEPQNFNREDNNLDNPARPKISEPNPGFGEPPHFANNAPPKPTNYFFSTPKNNPNEQAPSGANVQNWSGNNSNNIPMNNNNSMSSHVTDDQEFPKERGLAQESYFIRKLKSIKSKGDINLGKKIDTYAPMLRNSGPDLSNSSVARNDNDFGHSDNNWKPLSNSNHNMNGSNVKQENNVYGNTEDRMSRDRVERNGALPESRFIEHENRFGGGSDGMMRESNTRERRDPSQFKDNLSFNENEIFEKFTENGGNLGISETYYGNTQESIDKIEAIIREPLNVNSGETIPNNAPDGLERQNPPMFNAQIERNFEERNHNQFSQQNYESGQNMHHAFGTEIHRDYDENQMINNTDPIDQPLVENPQSRLENVVTLPPQPKPLGEKEIHDPYKEEKMKGFPCEQCDYVGFLQSALDGHILIEHRNNIDDLNQLNETQSFAPDQEFSNEPFLPSNTKLIEGHLVKVEAEKENQNTFVNNSNIVENVDHLEINSNIESTCNTDFTSLPTPPIKLAPDIDLNNILSTSKRKKKAVVYDEDNMNVVRDIVKDMETNSLQNVMNDAPMHNDRAVADETSRYTATSLCQSNERNETLSSNASEMTEMNKFSSTLPPKLKDVLKEKAIFENFMKNEGQKENVDVSEEYNKGKVVQEEKDSQIENLKEENSQLKLDLRLETEQNQEHMRTIQKLREYNETSLKEIKQKTMARFKISENEKSILENELSKRREEEETLKREIVDLQNEMLANESKFKNILDEKDKEISELLNRQRDFEGIRMNDNKLRDELDEKDKEIVKLSSRLRSFEEKERIVDNNNNDMHHIEKETLNNAPQIPTLSESNQCKENDLYKQGDITASPRKPLSSDSTDEQIESLETTQPLEIKIDEEPEIIQEYPISSRPVVDLEYLQMLISKHFLLDESSIVDEGIEKYASKLKGMEELKPEDLDKIYKMLNDSVTRLPEFRKISNLINLAGIILAKFFLKRFKFLPPTALQYYEQYFEALPPPSSGKQLPNSSDNLDTIETFENSSTQVCKSEENTSTVENNSNENFIESGQQGAADDNNQMQTKRLHEANSPIDVGQPTKRRRKESLDEGLGTDEDSGGITWPPVKGTMIATLFEDAFYIGKVCGSITNDGFVRVSYMERDTSRTPNHISQDEFWTWPIKQETFPTAQYSVLGENVELEPIDANKEPEYQDKPYIYALKDFEGWAALADKSKTSKDINKGEILIDNNDIHSVKDDDKEWVSEETKDIT